MSLDANKLAKIFVNENLKMIYVPEPNDDKRMNIYYSIKMHDASIRQLTPTMVFNYWLRYEKFYNTKNELIGKLYQQSAFFLYYYCSTENLYM